MTSRDGMRNEVRDVIEIDVEGGFYMARCVGCDWTDWFPRFVTSAYFRERFERWYAHAARPGHHDVEWTAEYDFETEAEMRAECAAREAEREAAERGVPEQRPEADL